MKLNKIIKLIEKKTFIYYNDINNRTLYIPRFVYEECQFLKIEFESHPKILMDKNYYSIPRSKITELEEKSNYKGIEKIIQAEKENQSSKLNNVIFAYKDGLTNLIYLPVKYTEATSGNTRMVMNQKCRAVHIRELERILNKKIYIVTVFLKPEEPEELILCKKENQLFIDEVQAVTFGLDPTNRKRIRVNNVLYLEISLEEKILLKIIATKNGRKIAFKEKNIIPKRGNI